MPPLHHLLLAILILFRVAESIPSSLIQIYAVILSNRRSAASLVSIFISIFTISFGATTVCFDFDLDPERRIHTPAFYGYVPSRSGARSIVLYAMFLFTVCHVSLRMIGIALLAVVSPLLAAAVLVSDMLFFMLFKLARNDFRYFLKLDGVLSWVVSFTIRFFNKLMVDFTIFIQCRHAQELGGIYWLVCIILGQGTSFVAVYLYGRSPEAEGSSVASLWALVGGLELAFILLLTIFVLTIDRNYRGTFFSTMTAKQFRIQSFREAKTDTIKVNVLKLHPSYYKSIRGEVEEWVKDNWERWNEEQPEWFTDVVKKRIPEDMIPNDNEDGREGSSTSDKGKDGERVTAMAGKRKQSSVGAAAEALRESMRESMDYD